MAVPLRHLSRTEGREELLRWPDEGCERKSRVESAGFGTVTACPLGEMTGRRWRSGTLSRSLKEGKQIGTLTEAGRQEARQVIEQP